jgi:hypothetical protein
MKKLLKYEKVFNEWVKRYAENPEDFMKILDENGEPVEDYGYVSARYFDKLMEELDG